MRVLFVSSEVFPYSKTGGLADVAGALPEALAHLGHEVLVITPWYNGLRSAAPYWIGDVQVPFDDGECFVGIGTLERNGVRFAFVGHEDFRREQLYGYADDVKRFCRFIRAAAPVAERLSFVPDLAHVHDWHGAYLPVLLQHAAHLPPGFTNLPTVLTVHNAQYQGLSEAAETVRWLRLPEGLSLGPSGQRGNANALAAGCLAAERITTVSPSYAQELLTAEYGYGLEELFVGVHAKLSGILNGIEIGVWNPEGDPHLPTPYGVGDLAGKSVAKKELCSRAGLDPGRPLLAVVSRLAEQKGIDILLEAVPALVARGWSIFILGSGEELLERGVRELAEKQEHFSANLDYDEPLAHLVYAAADALTIPSRFEPCGLSQLIAMRYGTLPIARATGGLKDTIVHGETGFLFTDLTPEALAGAAADALELYGTAKWAGMMRSAMTTDFSWTRSALMYENLYDELVRERDRS